jgi:hypothetical protein
MPVHHKLEVFLDEYIAAAGIAGDAKGPFFRTAAGKTDHGVDGRRTRRPSALLEDNGFPGLVASVDAPWSARGIFGMDSA